MKKLFLLLGIFLVPSICCVGQAQLSNASAPPTCFCCSCKIHKRVDRVDLAGSFKPGSCKTMHRECCFYLTQTYKDSYLKLLPPGDQETIRRVRGHVYSVKRKWFAVVSLFLGLPILTVIIALAGNC